VTLMNQHHERPIQFFKDMAPYQLGR